VEGVGQYFHTQHFQHPQTGGCKRRPKGLVIEVPLWLGTILEICENLSS
jgi:hypothetical protein